MNTPVTPKPHAGFDPACPCHGCDSKKSQSWLVAVMLVAMIVVPAVGAMIN